MQNVHLICNAHLDPVWMWEFEEGMYTALATFRAAAEFCDEFPGYVFNHNEAILYKWVEDLDPALFARIRELVAAGRWHIMGGWWLQPDCNMPSGESFVRQMLAGKGYFREKFGVEPTTAMNFDPFGHSRGLVQILKKCGYDSYMFCRPGPEDRRLPDGPFEWHGFDGSVVTAIRSEEHYNSYYGKAREKIEKWAERYKHRAAGLILWGVGNHGGGASRADLNDIEALKLASTAYNFIHSTPEAFFAEIAASGQPLPAHKDDINSWAPGCYTSQIRIKQKHRMLENRLYATEKACTHAAAAGLMAYPRAQLKEAQEDMLYAEFHDVIGGTCIQAVEEACIATIDHGLDIVAKTSMRAFAALAAGQPRGGEGHVPILAYNPHPFPVRGIFECELLLADINWDNGKYTMPVIHNADGSRAAFQPEQEASSVLVDWRKKVAIYAELKPGAMTRFDCRPQVVAAKPGKWLQPQGGKLTFDTGRLRAVISTRTGLLDSYCVDGFEYLKEGSARPVVIFDDDDPWGSTVSRFTNTEGVFTLMTPEEGARFSGHRDTILEPVRVIEDGMVRTVVEALFKYGDSTMVQTYRLPKFGTEIEIESRVYWNEKSRMLKLSFPTTLGSCQHKGQVPFGVQNLPRGGKEAVSQKWAGLFSQDIGKAFTVLNDCTYGTDCSTDGHLRISMLRSPAYAALPVGRDPITMRDRFIPRIDQGERIFTFRINGSDAESRRASVEREALAFNEKPMISAFYPGGSPAGAAVPAPEGRDAAQGIVTASDSFIVSALKQAEDGSGDTIIRIYNPTESALPAEFRLPAAGAQYSDELGPYEARTLRVDAKTCAVRQVGMLEV